MEVQKEDIWHEILEFAVSVVWMGIAFGISAFKDLVSLRTTIIEALVIVFFAFVFHELAHRVAARRYGFPAVYRVWIPGLILAMGAAMFGWLFAAPGGVVIQIPENTAENRAKLGKSALAGPVVNMVLAVVFAVAFVIIASWIAYTTSGSGSTSGIQTSLLNIAYIGAEINAWLAFFNLIPWGNFDGFKVFQWNKKVWVILFIISIALYAGTYFGQYALSG
jgi:Zn-dependent protease